MCTPAEKVADHSLILTLHRDVTSIGARYGFAALINTFFLRNTLSNTKLFCFKEQLSMITVVSEFTRMARST